MNPYLSRMKKDVHSGNIRVRDLPPEATQKARRRTGDDTLDLQEQERTSRLKRLFSS
jgi:hypothetical protein